MNVRTKRIKSWSEFGTEFGTEFGIEFGIEFGMGSMRVCGRVVASEAPDWSVAVCHGPHSSEEEEEEEEEWQQVGLGWSGEGMVVVGIREVEAGMGEGGTGSPKKMGGHKSVRGWEGGRRGEALTALHLVL